MPNRVPWSTLLLAAFFVFAGAMHFVVPVSYERIVPTWLPNAKLLVQISGVAEMLGGVGLLVPFARPAAGIGLLLLLIAVFPANVAMLQQAHAAGASAMWQAALWLRLPLQPALMWWVWRATLR
jgi:uncharacterized membrane protein